MTCVRVFAEGFRYGADLTTAGMRPLHLGLGLLAFAILSVGSLLYGSSFEPWQRPKYWTVFVIGTLVLRYFGAPYIAGFFGLFVAFALLAKALVPGGSRQDAGVRQG
jgi:hypothetical protein